MSSITLENLAGRGIDGLAVCLTDVPEFLKEIYPTIGASLLTSVFIPYQIGYDGFSGIPAIRHPHNVDFP